MSLPLMVFAAGKGTRMAPLTDTVPKPLIPVAGRPLLDRALELARQAGTGPVVVNIHHLGGQIRDHIGTQAAISDETELLLDTGGGLAKALPLLGAGPVITMNPDVIWTGSNPISALLAAWREDMDALLMLVPLARAHGRRGGGDFSLGVDSRLIRKGDLVYGGAQIIRPDRLEDIPGTVFSLNLLWDRLIADGRAHGLVHDGEWCDVGRPDCIPLAEALLDD
jgi:MurNAc alpha-1-phosphate uridylyltransferase